MTMMDLAHHIIAVAHENDIPVTNLQLQKVMFFSLRDAMNEKLLTKKVVEETYDQPFLVWRYGPVEKDIYEEYKVYGSDSITEPGEKFRLFDCLDGYIVELLNSNPFDLVNKSHAEDFWKHNSKYIIGWRSNIEYNLKNIQTGAV